MYKSTKAIFNSCAIGQIWSVEDICRIIPLTDLYLITRFDDIDKAWIAIKINGLDDTTEEKIFVHENTVKNKNFQIKKVFDTCITMLKHE